MQIVALAGKLNITSPKELNKLTRNVQAATRNRCVALQVSIGGRSLHSPIGSTFYSIMFGSVSNGNVGNGKYCIRGILIKALFVAMLYKNLLGEVPKHAINSEGG